MMKLSEALRLGAMIRSQAFGQYFDGVGSCAAGAAAEALGLRIDILSSGAIDEFCANTKFDTVLNEVQYCPACRLNVATALSGEGVMVHLNDYHHWTREAIADWIEGLEQAAELKVAQEAAVAVAA